MMHKKSSRKRPPAHSSHKVFVLRLWRETPDSEWRLAIQPHNEPRPKGLHSPSELLDYVLAEMNAPDAA